MHLLPRGEAPRNLRNPNVQDVLSPVRGIVRQGLTFHVSAQDALVVHQ